ncbi:hypothetical protein F4777DRAFT_600156 [Nemania sp. FL0916]|nr:hypothetical protein F4777DRAFT_600156 [Nemania sp. FL0916]
MNEFGQAIELEDSEIASTDEEKLLWATQQDETQNQIPSLHWGGLIFVTHGIILLSLILLYAAISQMMGQPPNLGANLVQSPARAAVSYTTVEHNHSLERTSPFFEPAKPTVDEAWENLLRYSLSAVKLDAQPSPVKILLQGSQGESVLMLDIFRSLGCMNTIRQYLYREYYGAQAPTQHQLNECIDQVRQALMCHLDIALGSYSWKEGETKPWPNFVIERECRNWDDIERWARDNSAPVAIKGLVSDN